MAVAAYVALRERTSPRWCRAFARGCRGRVIFDARLRLGPVALFGSPKLTQVLAGAIADGRTWYYGDHGYFRRFRFYRCTRNGYQHDGSGKGDEGRLKHLGVEVEPWRKGGRHILLCPPDEAYAARNGFSEAGWTKGTLAVLREHTDRPIRTRLRIGAEHNPVTLAHDLADCHALVTHHSNAAVEALCMGVPVFVTGECAARGMAETDLSRIETPHYPEDRKRWASVLAANQWSLEEMAAGDLWRAIGR